MHKVIRILKWIFLPLAVLANSFTVAYSAFPAELTNTWTTNVANVFTKIINTLTKKEVINIPMTELKTFVSKKDSYKYNDITGYNLNEIPLGSAKQVECTFSPENTTNSSISFYTDQNDLVSLYQSNNTVSVVGMGLGEVIIYAENKASGLVSSCKVKVVDTAEPKTFDISLDSNEIQLNSQATIKFDIDGGVLGHNELINSRYYDIRKLTYSSSNPSVCTIDQYGVIHPESIGESTITVKNKSGVKKTIDIQIVDGGVVPSYTDLKITGSDVCYGNDLIKDQDSNKNHYQLQIHDGEEELSAEDFIWESSNELLVKVDRKGVMRGFRKKTIEDEFATITATSKINGQSVTFDVTVKEERPTSMYYSIETGNKTSWNPSSFVACVGDTITTTVGYDINVSNKSIVATSSNEEIVDLTVQGKSFILYAKKTGIVTISFHSVANPDLKGEVSFEILKAGAIATDEIKDIGKTLRKSGGHALMFAIAQALTLITLIMFFYDKKQIWFSAAISLPFGLLMAAISELVQVFIPGRDGRVLDVLINFSGVAIGALIVIIVISIKEIIKNRKNKIASENGD